MKTKVIKTFIVTGQILLLVFFCSLKSFSKKLECLYFEAKVLYDSGDYSSAISIYEKILDKVYNQENVIYSICICNSKLRNKSEFIKYWKKLILIHPYYYEEILQSEKFNLVLSEITPSVISELKNLKIETQEKRGWKTLDSISQKKFDQVVGNLLTNDLKYRSQIKLFYSDSTDIFKIKFDSLMKLQLPLDSLNQSILDSLIQKLDGLPDLKYATKEQFIGICKIIQHTKNISKRKSYESLYRKSLKKNDALYEELPKIIDRTRMLENKKQLFGGTKVGSIEVEIKNEKKVNTLRIKYGITPFYSNVCK